ncbi:MAG: hypothetical protein AAF217_02775 [Pseudomonadota bacterium]
MGKHHSFWIGAFAGILLTIICGVTLWWTADDISNSLLVFFLGVVFCFVLGVIGLLFFRQRLFPGFFRNADSTADEISENLTRSIVEISKKEYGESIESASRALKSAIGWVAWAHFYRWVFGTCIAVLLAFGGIAGTALLFEQNKKLTEQTRQLALQSEQLSEQNALFSMTLVPELRSRLKSSGTETIIGNEREDVIHNDGCRLKFLDAKLSSGPNLSTVGSVHSLTKSTYIGETVKEALRLLIHDQDSSVALGALLVLDELEVLEEDEAIRLRGLHIRNLEIRSKVSLIFENSHITRFKCPSCTVAIRESVYLDSYSPQMSEISLSYVSREGEGFRQHERSIEVDGTAPIDSYGGEYASVVSGAINYGSDSNTVENNLKQQYASPYIVNYDLKELSGCSLLKTLGDANAFVQFEE